MIWFSIKYQECDSTFFFAAISVAINVNAKLGKGSKDDFPFYIYFSLSIDSVTQVELSMTLFW